MRIYVYSRDGIEHRLRNEPELVNTRNIISIYSFGDRSPITVRKPNILKLEFDDITEREYEKYRGFYQLFTKQQAEEIKNYAKTIDQSMDMIVHCDAGISRSGAVGFCLNCYFNNYLKDIYKDMVFFYDTNRHLVPNPYVIRVLNNVLYEDTSDVKETTEIGPVHVDDTSVKI